jgi:hypothetical protein
MTQPAFNMLAALVMGAVAGGALVLAPGAAHDVCLAVVSGLAGALAASSKPQA